ncbi:MAG TPA: clostripain-related cysteine peptidase [Pyrinomonadaceae bacterium]|nr:clostripain-related cysteine peptidase [Pyrinomonadaceae bacterium]
MSKNEETDSTKRPVRQWTLMFYFAGDNPLAPSIVSQLKSIKDAGFHDEANVIARFDPHTENTPSHIFDVNLINKLEAGGKPRIGPVPHDTLARTLVSDKLWRDDEVGADGDRRPIKERIREALKIKNSRNAKAKDYDPPQLLADSSPEPSPQESLRTFLKFCREAYPARNYILFLLGHGLVVGNDIFLFDEHVFPRLPASLDIEGQSGQADGGGKENGSRRQAQKATQQDSASQRDEKDTRENSLTLAGFKKVLSEFTSKIAKPKNRAERGELQLVSFHSCSMSGAEVAYELQGTANYMLASQGPAFASGWPYRAILSHIFKALCDQQKSKKPLDVKKNLIDIFFYILQNSLDFQLAGYSFDLCLSNLNKVGDLDVPLRKLTDLLIRSLEDKKNTLAKDLILLSHWDAQSFWQESYHDLYDYCLRLRSRCLKTRTGSKKTDAVLDEIAAACKDVLIVLKKGTQGADDELIVRAEFGGAASQYSHGFSVFFPWSEPVGNELWDKEYEHYQFNQRTGWKKFLDTYFRETMRGTRREEIEAGDDPNVEAQPVTYSRQEKPGEALSDTALLGLIEDISSSVFPNEGPLAADTLGGKHGSTDPTGDDCGCRSIKNYPPYTQPRARGTRTPRATGTVRKCKHKLPVSEGIFESRKLLD